MISNGLNRSTASKAKRNPCQESSKMIQQCRRGSSKRQIFQSDNWKTSSQGRQKSMIFFNFSRLEEATVRVDEGENQSLRPFIRRPVCPLDLPSPQKCSRRNPLYQACPHSIAPTSRNLTHLPPLAISCDLPPPHTPLPSAARWHLISLLTRLALAFRRVRSRNVIFFCFFWTLFDPPIRHEKQILNHNAHVSDLR